MRKAARRAFKIVPPYSSICLARNAAATFTALSWAASGTAVRSSVSRPTTPITSPDAMMGAAHSTTRGEPSQGRMHFSATPSHWYSLRPSISFSSGWLMLRSASSRRPLPLTVRMRSRSATKVVSAKLLLSTSVYWAATAFISPMGEYFLKITSPSPVVKISSGSPRRMRWVRRISLGITTRPSSSHYVK